MPVLSASITRHSSKYAQRNDLDCSTEGAGWVVVMIPPPEFSLEFEMRPPKDEHRSQNRHVDQNPNPSLVVQPLHPPVPEEDEDHGGEGGRAHDDRAPPGLPQQDPRAAGHQTDGSQRACHACQPSRGSISQQLGECPRAIGPGHLGLKLKEPASLPEVEQMDQAVQYDERTDNEPQHGTPTLSSGYYTRAGPTIDRIGVHRAQAAVL